MIFARFDRSIAGLRGERERGWGGGAEREKVSLLDRLWGGEERAY